MNKVNNSVISFPSQIILSYTEITENSIKLTWTKSIDTDFKNYTIYISQDNITWNFLTSISDINTISYNATSLNPNTTYYFKIRVYNSLGLFNDSIPISAKTSSENSQNPIQNPSSETKNDFPILYIGIIGVIVISIVILTIFLIKRNKLKSKVPKYSQYPYQQYQQPMQSYPQYQQQYPYHQQTYQPQTSQYQQISQNIVCPSCHSSFQVSSQIRPLQIQCPYCGLKGELK